MGIEDAVLCLQHNKLTNKNVLRAISINRDMFFADSKLSTIPRVLNIYILSMLYISQPLCRD